VGQEQITIRAAIPGGYSSLPQFLPIVQALTDAVVDAAAREASRANRSISCGPHCGACCRQLVPVAEAEAVFLKLLIDGMEESRRARIQQRIEVARARLSEAGLLAELGVPEAFDSADRRRTLGLKYFRLGIPCPFLDNESCSIHSHRPLSCREFLVTSDPRQCADPSAEGVESIRLPQRPSAILYRFGDGIGTAPARWLPLVTAISWVECSEAQLTERSFPTSDLFHGFLQALAGVSPEGNDALGTKLP
jgi:Fe-S-cluster containining protein